MLYSQDINIGIGDNSSNNFYPTVSTSLITKEVSEPYLLEKLVTSHNFSILRLYIKGIIWVGGIAFDLVASA